MDSSPECSHIVQEFETEQEYQKKCAELKTTGFEECKTHNIFSDLELDKAIQQIITESMQSKRVMIVLRHANKLSIWIEHPLLSNQEIIEALNNGFRLSNTFPPNKKDAMVKLLGKYVEGHDYLFIAINGRVTLWMKSVYTKISFDLRAAIIDVIKKVPTS